MLFILFVCGLSSNSRIFHSLWDDTITGEGLQILTYTRRSCIWQFPNKKELYFTLSSQLWYYGTLIYNEKTMVLCKKKHDSIPKKTKTMVLDL